MQQESSKKLTDYTVFQDTLQGNGTAAIYQPYRRGLVRPPRGGRPLIPGGGGRIPRGGTPVGVPHAGGRPMGGPWVVSCQVEKP